MLLITLKWSRSCLSITPSMNNVLLSQNAHATSERSTKVGFLCTTLLVPYHNIPVTVPTDLTVDKVFTVPSPRAFFVNSGMASHWSLFFGTHRTFTLFGIVTSNVTRRFEVGNHKIWSLHIFITLRSNFAHHESSCALSLLGLAFG